MRRETFLNIILDQLNHLPIAPGRDLFQNLCPFSSFSGHPSTRLPTALPRTMVSPIIPFGTLLALLCVAVPATAHMCMTDPPPLRYKENPYKTVIDYDYTNPLSSNGSNYPCKGYNKDLGTPSAQSVATWSPGGSYSLK